MPYGKQSVSERKSRRVPGLVYRVRVSGYSSRRSLEIVHGPSGMTVDKTGYAKVRDVITLADRALATVRWNVPADQLDREAGVAAVRAFRACLDGGAVTGVRDACRR